ncbi:MAG: TPM domain-containing protein [Cyanobacteria bacterium P01_G01_bin.38]
MRLRQAFGISCGTLLATGIALAAQTTLAKAIEVGDVPNPRQRGGWVTDMADILSPATETELNQLISDLEAHNGTEIAVVTVSDTAGAASPKAFVHELFNTWGVGKATVNNGVVFLVSVGDRRAEIETGYGVVKILPDQRVTALLKQRAVPRFKEGDYDRSVLPVTEGIITILEDSTPYSPVISPLMDLSNGIKVLILAGGGVLAFFARGLQKDHHERTVTLPRKTRSSSSNSSRSSSRSSSSGRSSSSRRSGGGRSGGSGGGASW